MLEEWARRDPIERLLASASSPSTAFDADEVERDPRRGQGLRRRVRRRRRSPRRCPTRRSPPRASSPTSCDAARRRPGALVALERTPATPHAPERAAVMARDDLSGGDLGRAARGDAPRRDGLLHRRGHRRLRRRVQGHRRVHRGVRRRARARHAAGRERDHRRRGRRRGRGPAAGLRDAVRRLHRLRLRPARQRRRQAALPPGRRGADGRPAAVRRRLLRRPVPLPEPRGLVPAVAGAQGRGAGDRRRRQGPADGGDPRSEPGLLPRAQGPLPPRQGRGPRGRATRSSSARRGSPARARR